MKERQIIAEAKCRNCGNESINLFPPGISEPFECAHCGQIHAFRSPGMWFEVWVEESTDWAIITLEDSPNFGSRRIQGIGETVHKAFRDLTSNIRVYASKRSPN